MRFQFFLPNWINRNKTALTIFVFCVAFLLRLVIAYNYLVVDTDKLAQVSASISIMKGQGYTMPFVKATNLNSVMHQHLVQWPPGYSVALIPILKLTNSNIELSCFILEAVVTFLFFVVFYLILQLLGFPHWLRLLLLLFRGAEINDYIIYSSPSDLMGLLVWAIVAFIAVKYIVENNSWALILMILMNASAPWIRYANLAVIFVLPGVLLGIAILYKSERKRLIIPALLTLLVSVLSTSGLLWFNYSRSESLFYTVNANQGFYISNLREFGPVLLAAWADVNFVLLRLSLLTGQSYAFWVNVFKVVNPALLFGFICWFIVYLNKKKATPLNSDPSRLFFIIIACLSAAVVVSLCYVSVRNNLRIYGSVGGEWTYIQEPRYMLLLQFFIQLFVCHQLFVQQDFRQHLMNKILRPVILAIISLGILHGCWFAVKILNNKNQKLPNQNNWKQTSLYLDQIRVRVKRENVELILAGRNLDYKAYGAIHDLRVIFDPIELNSVQPCSTRKELILFRVKRGHESLYGAFLSRKKVIKTASVNDFDFYEYYIPSCKE